MNGCVSKITRPIIMFFKGARELPSVGCSSFVSFGNERRLVGHANAL